MNKQSLNTTIVTGQIGIIDALLIRFLEKIKKSTGHVMVHVTESIYKSIIPISHIYEFLVSLSFVDGTIEDKSQLRRFLQNPNTVSIDIPVEELQQYSIERILKQVGIENGKNEPDGTKLTDLNELLTRYGSNPHKREIKVGLVSGSFDLIHLGHIRYIKAAKETADVVVAATMSTASIKQQQKNIKGDRPIYNQENRVKVLSALQAVDDIIVFDQLDCKDVIQVLKPNYFIKNQKDMSRQIVKEECELVETLGGEVVPTTDDTGYSSTDIIDHIRNTRGEE